MFVVKNFTMIIKNNSTKVTMKKNITYIVINLITKFIIKL